MSSKADNFDVRHRDAGETGHGHPGASGGYTGNVDYDLGYDANGWDTNGFRSPEADYLDSHDAGRAATVGAGHASASATATASAATGSYRTELAGTQEIAPLQLEPGPGGPGGPQGPRGPGRRGPSRRGPSRSKVKVKVKGSWWRHWTLRKVLGLLLSIIGGIVVLGAIAVVMVYNQTPVPTEAMAATGFTQSVVYASDGKTLIGRFGTTNRQMLTYNQLQQNQWVVDAVLAAEDRNFFNEGGISPTGIVRAAYQDVRGSNGSLQGGSTITQEFVRNYYSGIGTRQTLSRKIKEIFVAMKVGKDKSKQWILTNYLNTIYLGEGAYGIGAAAQTYYNEPVSKLTAAQAAVIAAIIQQPSTYPLAQYRPELEARWHYVLDGMVQMGTLTAQQANTTKFPVPGDYIPQTVGSDVWDPYVLNVVYNELTDVYHLSQSQIDNGGYTIRTSIDDAKIKALYEAVQQNEEQMVQGGVALPDYAQVGAVLENPADGSIQAMYPGPGYPNSQYVTHLGTKRTMTVNQCTLLHCEVNMAVYNREQVGSSFKPYVLSTAVSQGMNVQTSTLNGYDPLWIPPASLPTSIFSSSAPQLTGGWYKVTNDSGAENGPFTAQVAMAASVNTAYTDLWHHAGAAAVANMAAAFGVNTAAACITANCGTTPAMRDEAGVALGQAALTVGEQATMLATIDDGGVYHDAHVVTSITQNNVATPIKITSHLVFNPDPAMNEEEASQVQYAMSEDTASYGTAPGAALSNGQEIIAKTGTTNTAQSAFFIGAIPTQALAVGIFTDKFAQSLPADLGGNAQGGYGGTWPALIWHTYAENEFVPLGIEPFPTPVFTGAAWNNVPPNLRKVAKKHKKPTHGHGKGNGHGNGNQGGGQPGGGNPNPFPTYSCDPSVVTCGAAGTTQSVTATRTGAAIGGGFAALPPTAAWVRRRMRRRGSRRG